MSLLLYWDLLELRGCCGYTPTSMAVRIHRASPLQSLLSCGQDPWAGTLITNIPLGGKPEYGASAGDGKVYANLTDTNEVVEIKK